MDLSELKKIFQQSPVITIYGAPVKYKIEDLYIALEWRGLDTGALYVGGINKEGIDELKVVDFNTIAVRLAHLEKGKVVFNKNWTPISFWHNVGIPILT